jgi:MFS family permease
MTASRRIICFINIGHAIDHMFMRADRELIALSLGGFIAFGAGSVPAGWLRHRWSRRNMMAIFFSASALQQWRPAFARMSWELAAGLAAIGLLAAIYHPVGTAMLIAHAARRA